MWSGSDGVLRPSRASVEAVVIAALRREEGEVKHPIDYELSEDGKLSGCYVTLFPHAKTKESRILLDKGGFVLGDFDSRGRLIGVEIIGPGWPKKGGRK